MKKKKHACCGAYIIVNLFSFIGQKYEKEKGKQTITKVALGQTHPLVITNLSDTCKLGVN